MLASWCFFFSLKAGRAVPFPSMSLFLDVSSLCGALVSLVEMLFVCLAFVVLCLFVFPCNRFYPFNFTCFVGGDPPQTFRREVVLTQLSQCSPPNPSLCFLSNDNCARREDYNACPLSQTHGGYVVNTGVSHRGHPYRWLAC